MKFLIPTPKRIKEIFKDIPFKLLSGSSNNKIYSLSYRSKECSEGSIFFCIKGFKYDGHKFIPEALSKGAIAVVVEENISPIPDITVLRVSDTRYTLALASSVFFENPSEQLKVIGVTGTNGKTTVSFMINSILQKAGNVTGLLGTVNYKIGDEFIPVGRTTPESLDLQNYLFLMKRNRCKYAVMEVSSHAIALKRIDGCKYYCGILTNVTHDHLDFHKTFSEYLQVKKSFFVHYLNRDDSFAILNADDENFKIFSSKLPIPFVTYSVKNKSDFTAKNVVLSNDGIKFSVKVKNHKENVFLKLCGLFNVYNSLSAIAFTSSIGIDFSYIESALTNFCPVAGRFERIEEGQEFNVIVDYAHTPDGLENVLKSAREITKGKLCVVFGCGGDRDKGKRRIMGRVSAKYADFTIITSDNPRSEDPTLIAEEILSGFLEIGEKDNYIVELDRFIAIERAVSLARNVDTVIIAGKGHENYQVFKDKTINFDDREVARIILRRSIK